MKNLTHKQITIPLKYVQVDEEIAPLLNWLNSFDDIHTTFSCQGRKNYKFSAYVIYYNFYCRNDNKTDIFIKNKIKEFSDLYDEEVIRFNLFGAVIYVDNHKSKLLKKMLEKKFIDSEEKIEKLDAASININMSEVSITFPQFEIRFRNKMILKTFIKFLKLNKPQNNN